MAITNIGSITGKCAECGNDKVRIAEDDGMTCTKCGADLGMVEDYNQEATRLAKKAMPDIEKALKKALKNLKLG